MLRVGLTGGIGSGKTLIAKVFGVLGVPVFEADAVARHLTDSNPQIQSELIDWLGEDIFRGNRVDRTRLAHLVFNDPRALQKLNGIIHPHVADAFNRWIGQQKGSSYVIHEAAILFESGYDQLMDYTILVTCPDEVRLERIEKRDGLSKPEILSRFVNQWPEERKRALADAVICNDGNELITPQVLYLNKIIKERSNG